MATAKMTLIGYNNWFESFNQDLFEYLTVPTGIDRSLLINNILLKGGEFEVLYGDPNFTKNMIGVWSSKWQHTLERWVNALSIDYNPLENYDRMEDWTDNGQKMTSSSQKDNQDRIASSTNSEETKREENAIGNDFSKSEGSGDTTNTRSAYNSSVYQPHDKSESSSEGKNTSSSLTSADGKTSTDSITNNIDSVVNSSTGTGSEINGSIHSGRMHGNIGVTTSQQMLEAELNIAKWNLYDEIADLFISEFCIYLY